tara:strand:- start:1324 stop:1554 length:231 start_codon:yes stop_codon:yes gene_type:complete
MVKELGSNQKAVLIHLTNRIVEIKTTLAVLENDRNRCVAEYRAELSVPTDWAFQSSSMKFSAPKQPQESEEQEQNE